MPKPCDRELMMDIRSQYKFGRTLGAGTYGIVREAECGGSKYAIKIILKKNVKGNEKMVYDEMVLLQRMKHPHIVRFHDWFESKVRSNPMMLGSHADNTRRISIILLLSWLPAESSLTGFANLANSPRRMPRKQFDRSLKQSTIFTTTMWSIEVRFSWLGIVHDADDCLDLKPENLLYLTSEPDSSLVLADFGIAKMLDSKDGVLSTMAGSFGYAAPEIMLKQGHGKPVDMWSLGVITYTLLCGYSPFRSENVADLVDECKSGRIIFHGRYWKDVSHEAKDFIVSLLQPDPSKRLTSEQALRDVWLSGKTATEFNLLPEFRAYMAKARLKRGIEIIKLANRIEALRMQEDDETDTPGQADIPANSGEMAGQVLTNQGTGSSHGLPTSDEPKQKKSLSSIAKGAIFREVVFAKVREEKEKAEHEEAERVAAENAKKASPGK